MSNLKPSMIGLDKGLNLQTAKIVAPQGSVLDTLNYEQVDFQGQKRIDGFTRFDGSVLSAVDDYLYIELEGEGAYSYAVGTILSSDLGVFGVVAVSGDGSWNQVAVLNEKNIPAVGDSVYNAEDDTGGYIVLTVQSGVEYREGDPDAHYEDVLAVNAAIRNRVETLPGPVAGLHWFRDRLHAIAGVTYAVLEGSTPRIYPTQQLHISGGGQPYNVLDSFVHDGMRIVFLDDMDSAQWSVPFTSVYREGELGLEEVGIISEFYPNMSVSREIASIFEARSEQQVLEEDAADAYDFGWRFIHLGWKVNFEEGNSLYGSLPSINQNIEGIGIQGPTDTTGTNGAAGALYQAVQTANTDQQVNGWKVSSTPTSYALNAEAVQDEDTQYVYADAYISWDGDTGSVTGYVTPLREYSAAATIEVEV